MAKYLSFPVDGGRITSGYGWRYHPTDKTEKIHTGIDIAPPTPGQQGVLVLSSAPGKCTAAENTGGAYGNQIIVAHDKGLQTIYCHLAEMRVKPGETVNRGQVIGIMGNTGTKTTGIHLHFETWLWGVRIDPLVALGLEGYRNIAGHIEDIPLETFRRVADGKVFVEARAVVELLGGIANWNESEERLSIDAAIIKLAETICKKRLEVLVG